MDDDIIYQDDYICLLKPDSEYGVEIAHYSKYQVCDGLYSYAGLVKYNKPLPFHRKSHSNDDFIFFRPSRNPDLEPYITTKDYEALVRVNPDKSYVYSSELWHHNSYLYRNSRISLTDFIINGLMT